MCEIIFDNPEKVYYGGQTLTGTAIITLDKEKSVKGIYIHIFGAAECRWCEHVRIDRLTYRGNEVYLSNKNYFMGSEDGDTITVPVGVHTFSFECELSHNLPNTFEATYGSIRYKAIVTFDTSIWPDKSFEEEFYILKRLDLNDYPELKMPALIEMRSGFNKCYVLWCLQTKPLTISAKLSKTGFKFGQNIDVSLEIINESNIKINNFKIGFYKIVTYTAIDNAVPKQKNEFICIAEHSTGERNGIANEFFNVQFPVARHNSTPITDISSSKVFKIRYKVQISVDVGPFHNFPTIKFPIVIGSTDSDVFYK